MDIVLKITLVASIVMVGYNLHQLVTSYEIICEKVKEFRMLAQQNESDENAVRRSNFLLTGALSVVFVLLTYFSGLAYWLVGTVLAKMVVSMIFSHLELKQIFKDGVICPKLFRITKADAAMNVLVGLGVAVVSIL